MFDIEKFLDLTNYEQSRNERRKGHSSTAEFFTPYEIVKNMCNEISKEDWSNPEKTFLEPSFGSGQFIIYIIWNRIQHNIPWQIALQTCYGVELMQDNVDEMKERIHTMLLQICPDYNKASATRIMNKNFVCHDFFTWNFEEWREMTEEEIKKTKKK